MSLALSDQICFPLYAASRALQQRYRPLLADLGLTYPQYLVMLVLWEQDGLSVKALGRHLQLDSGTLTPVLKRMEAAELLTRSRSSRDGRVVEIALTPAGHALRERAQDVPVELLACMPDTSIDLSALKTALDQLLSVLSEPS